MAIGDRRDHRGGTAGVVDDDKETTMIDEPNMSVPLLEECPLCHTQTEQGFGLAGGGYGVYVYCPNDGCDYFTKLQVED